MEFIEQPITVSGDVTVRSDGEPPRSNCCTMCRSDAHSINLCDSPIYDELINHFNIEIEKIRIESIFSGYKYEFRPEIIYSNFGRKYGLSVCKLQAIFQMIICDYNRNELNAILRRISPFEQLPPSKSKKIVLAAALALHVCYCYNSKFRLLNDDVNVIYKNILERVVLDNTSIQDNIQEARIETEEKREAVLAVFKQQKIEHIRKIREFVSGRLVRSSSGSLFLQTTPETQVNYAAAIQAIQGGRYTFIRFFGPHITLDDLRRYVLRIRVFLRRENITELRNPYMNIPSPIQFDCNVDTELSLLETECPICYETTTDAITVCKHEFCGTCIGKHINSCKTRNLGKIDCPMCRTEIKSATVKTDSISKTIYQLIK